MLAFSFETQTQRVKDLCLHFILSSFFLSPFPSFCTNFTFILHIRYKQLSLSSKSGLKSFSHTEPVKDFIDQIIFHGFPNHGSQTLIGIHKINRKEIFRKPFFNALLYHTNAAKSGFQGSFLTYISNNHLIIKPKLPSIKVFFFFFFKLVQSALFLCRNRNYFLP